MVMASDFSDAVKIAIDEGIDLVVAWAGFSAICSSWQESGTPIVLIVFAHSKSSKISEKLRCGHVCRGQGSRRTPGQISPRNIIHVRAAVKIPTLQPAVF